MKAIVQHTAMGLALAGAVALPVMAADRDDDTSTSVRLSAEARRMVPQDRLQATLNIEASAKTAVAAQAAINSKMQAALAVAKRVEGVKPTTGGYNVWKQYENEPQPKPGMTGWTPEQREKHAYWQANQQLNLDGADKEVVLKLVGTLQEQGFAVQGLNFYLSREATDALRDDLTEEALDTIKQRAERMAKVLGMRTVRYAQIDLDGNRPPVMPMMARAMKVEMMAADAGSAPAAQAGESEVAVTVSAEVKMK